MMAVTPKSGRLIAEIRTVAVSMIVVDRVEKAGADALRIEMNDLGGLVLHFAGNSASLREGEQAIASIADKFSIKAITTIIDRPHPGAARIIDLKMEFQPLLNQFSITVPEEDILNKVPDMKAIGIIETQGFTAITSAIDAATKAADVTVVAREKLGGGYIAIVIEGDVSAVEAATATAREVCEEFDALIATEVIARPSDGVRRLIAACALG